MLPIAGAHSRDPGGAAATTWLAASGAENGRRCATAALGLPPAQDALFITCISLAGLRMPNAVGSPIGYVGPRLAADGQAYTQGYYTCCSSSVALVQSGLHIMNR
jgi:hypothetical protein